MQTTLAEFIKDTPEGREAEAILRKCVHCGFCTATCPTYQLLGDELDGPRGRIYLIKQVLEGVPAGKATQLHLDRCLSCRACETTCPSGVEYGRLADIGRAIVEQQVPRSAGMLVLRRALVALLTRTRIFSAALRLGQAMRKVLPSMLAKKIPPPGLAAGAWPTARHARRMLVLAGCVQPAMAPRINAAAARVLDRLGISLIEVPGAGCCGALRYHMTFQQDGLADMRRLIDAWWPAIERGDTEAIVMTASGCGAVVREFGHLLAQDSAYAEKAARISAMTRDLSEIVAAEPALPTAVGSGTRVAVHAPCSLQHGQQLRGGVEALLERAGYELTPVADGHLCCGSAGSYSILQPELANRLRENKLRALNSGQPETIVTANIGCLSHLAAGGDTPVRHWIELLDVSH
jgi:glycolate oxidase iron-sulfur subunit